MARLALLCILFTSAAAFAPPSLSLSLRLPSRHSARCAPSSSRLTALRMAMDDREKFQMEMEKAISDERYADAAKYRDALTALGDAAPAAPTRVRHDKNGGRNAAPQRPWRRRDAPGGECGRDTRGPSATRDQPPSRYRPWR
ncbi:hypothetical protein T484DRAFT_1888448 [Baffinella frigidus]|nr:hypothetical protein T484DRAFT_1888448 [Cryptophyta sp. CCMP2293]